MTDQFQLETANTHTQGVLVSIDDILLTIEIKRQLAKVTDYYVNLFITVILEKLNLDSLYRS